jgi:DNA-directed RNA polymerase subunit RPC12/RpoP
MQTVNFTCGHCGKLMGVSADFLGRQVRCPHCQQVVVAPAAQGSAGEPTLPHVSTGPATNQDETSILPSPHNLDDEDSIFAERPRDILFDEPQPPPLDLSAPATHPDLPIEPRDGTPPGPALDATLSFHPDAASAGSAVADVPAGPEVPDWLTSSVPAANGAVADLPAAARPKSRSSLGLLLFISLVFMPLVLYSVLVTVLAVLLYSKNLVNETPDPREYLIDTDGDHPGVKKTKAISQNLNDQVDAQRVTTALPARLQMKIGDSLTLGDLLVKAERVEFGKIDMEAKKGGKPEVREALILRLHLENRSSDAEFYPMDAFFTRKSEGTGSGVPYTVLMAGDRLRFFGGPAIYTPATERYDVLNTFYNQALKPGASLDTFVCTNGPDPRYDSDPLQKKFNELLSHKGNLVWHVQIRRGLTRWKDHDYPTTGVFGVTFTDADIKRPPD